VYTTICCGTRTAELVSMSVREIRGARLDTCDAYVPPSWNPDDAKNHHMSMLRCSFPTHDDGWSLLRRLALTRHFFHGVFKHRNAHKAFCTVRKDLLVVSVDEEERPIVWVDQDGVPGRSRLLATKRFQRNVRRIDGLVKRLARKGPV